MSLDLLFTDMMLKIMFFLTSTNAAYQLTKHGPRESDEIIPSFRAPQPAPNIGMILSLPPPYPDIPTPTAKPAEVYEIISGET